MSNAIVAIKPAYLDLAGTASYLSLPESTVQKIIREDAFPKPRLLSGRRVGWLVRELQDWAESRPVADCLPPANTGAKKPRTATTSCGRQP